MKLICKLSDDDSFILEESKIINLNASKDFMYTFWRQDNVYPRFYQEEALDLLYLSMGVFSADRLFVREEGSDAWSREIELYVPVLSIEKWNTCKLLVERMLSFLTGDNWTVNFRERSLVEKETSAKEKWEKLEAKKDAVSKICMFSGGLDSCIGALNLLTESLDCTDVLFVSHYGGGKGTKEYQDALKSMFIEKFSLEEEQFIQNYAAVISGIEDTTRSRSLMFFAHAIAYASTMGKMVDLIIPENGLISLNIPLAHTRSGTSSTRTTHPHYMTMLQELLIELGIDVRIMNPFQFKTKGEMVLECKNREFLQQVLANTMSCSHPDVGRHKGMRKTMHCGYCLPCTIRKAAILRGNLNDTSTYWDENYKSIPIAEQAYRTYTYALANLDEDMAFLKIQLSGPIKNDIDAFADLYVRGMKEVKEYLEQTNV